MQGKYSKTRSSAKGIKHTQARPISAHIIVPHIRTNLGYLDRGVLLSYRRQMRTDLSVSLSHLAIGGDSQKGRSDSSR